MRHGLDDESHEETLLRALGKNLKTQIETSVREAVAGRHGQPNITININICLATATHGGATAVMKGVGE